MIKVPKDDNAYLQWVVGHPDGFIVNGDKRKRARHYPIKSS